MCGWRVAEGRGPQASVKLADARATVHVSDVARLTYLRVTTSYSCDLGTPRSRGGGGTQSTNFRVMLKKLTPK